MQPDAAYRSTRYSPARQSNSDAGVPRTADTRNKFASVRPRSSLSAALAMSISTGYDSNVLTRFYVQGYVGVVGRFARHVTIECIYRCETGFGFSCGHSENPKPVSQRISGKNISKEYLR